jgi:hypothetical protein
VTDPQMKEFAGRLRRIERIHRRGGGFEAAGTLGQSYYTRLRRRAGRPVLRPALMALGMVILFKATLLAHLGEAEYEARLATLSQGHWGERAGAFVMAIDPLAARLSAALAPIVP